MNMSMEYYTACEAYGATAHFVGEKVFAPAFGRGIDLHSTTGMGQFNGATHMMHEGAVISASARVAYITDSRHRVMCNEGGSPALDGSNDYIDTGNTAIVTEMDSDFSFAIWFNTFGNTVAASETLFGCNGGSANTGYPQLWCKFQASNSTIRLQIKNDAGTLWKADTGALANITTGPHLFGCSFDWSEATGSGTVPASFYYDGQAAGYTASSEGNLAAGTTNAGDQKVYLGARSDKATSDGAAANHSTSGYGPFPWFGGTVLTATQHADLYRIGRMPERTDSVYRMGA